MAEAAAKPRRRWGRIIFITALIAIPIIFIALARRKPTIEPGTVLTLSLEGDIEESSPDSPLERLLESIGGTERTPSLHEIRRALHHAKDDHRIAGVLLEIRSLRCGWAVVDELRGLVGEVRGAGKPVQALLSSDFIEEKDYAIAAAAGRVVLSPQAGLLLNGLLAEVTFYRGLLDWLKVEPEVLQMKEYKSAFEPFVRANMSEPMRQSLTALISEIHGRFLSQVSQARKIDGAKLRQMLDRGLLTAAEGLKAGLVDATGYRDELEEALGAGDQKKRAGVLRYLRALPDDPRPGNVALIYATGPILSGMGQGGFGDNLIEGPKLARTVREAAEDESIKAIVLRVDSPGGSAVGSDVVWREIQRARGKKKPVVVSMGTVAASGGYWISMGADAIVAQPSTLTGSIGVLFSHFNVLPLWNRMGLTIDTIKLGDNADLLSPYKSWTPDQKTRIASWMQQVYDDFVARVAKGRKLSPELVEPMAHGRVWSGSQAKERKLVDELGGLDVALRIAREKAGLPATGPEPVLFPRQRGLLAALSQMNAALQARPDPQAILRQLARELGASGPALLAPNIDLH